MASRSATTAATPKPSLPDSTTIASPDAPPVRGTVTVGTFLAGTWLPHKRRHVRADHGVPVRVVRRPLHQPRRSVTSLCVGSALDHLDDLYERLATTGGRHGAGLAPKTIAEVHMIVRAALDLAVAPRTRRPQRRPRTPEAAAARSAHASARSWTALELRQFLTAARPQRLYPALHLAAHTGMRRGEIVGLKWSDLDAERSRLSISRTIQNVGGRPIEFGVKTRTSRRTVELDHTTRDLLVQWRRRVSTTISCRTAPMTGCSATRSAGSSTPNRSRQLFDRVVRRSELPRIRFHDLRHTHASLLVAAGVADQSRVRTTRSRPPCVHDAHLPAPAARA